MDKKYKYLLIDPFKMTSKRWAAVVQNKYAQCRKHADGRIVLKYRGYHPILFFAYSTYTRAQVLDILHVPIRDQLIPKESSSS